MLANILKANLKLYWSCMHPKCLLDYASILCITGTDMRVLLGTKVLGDGAFAPSLPSLRIFHILISLSGLKFKQFKMHNGDNSYQ